MSDDYSIKDDVFFINPNTHIRDKGKVEDIILEGATGRKMYQVNNGDNLYYLFNTDIINRDSSSHDKGNSDRKSDEPRSPKRFCGNKQKCDEMVNTNYITATPIKSPYEEFLEKCDNLIESLDDYNYGIIRHELELYKESVIVISEENNERIEELYNKTVDQLDRIRIYTVLL